MKILRDGAFMSLLPPVVFSDLADPFKKSAVANLTIIISAYPDTPQNRK
jgi:hypothetical protein